MERWLANELRLEPVYAEISLAPTCRPLVRVVFQVLLVQFVNEDQLLSHMLRRFALRALRATLNKRSH